jgi:hypothetical protein
MSMSVSVHRVPRLISNTIKINLDETLVFDEKVFDRVDIDPANITYKSSNAKIAVMNGDTLTPLKTGTVNVTVVAGTKKFTAKVIIYDPKLTAPDIVYMNNKTVSLKITSGDNTTTWTSSDNNILSITNKGVIKGLSQGHVTVTAVNNERVLTKDIYVCPVPKFNYKAATLNLDQTLSLNNELFDDSGIGNVEYSSNNTKIAYIQDNKLIPMKTGKVTVTAKVDNKKYTIPVTIYNPTLVAPDIV